MWSRYFGLKWIYLAAILASLFLGACSKVSRTPVIQVSDGLFLEGDSVILFLRHRYVWYEESGPLVVGSDQEDGSAQILKLGLTVQPQPVLDLSGLRDNYVFIQQQQGDTLVYGIESSNDGSSKTYFRDLESGAEVSYKANYGGRFRISYRGGFIVHPNQIRNRFSGEIVEDFEFPRYSDIIFFDEVNQNFVISDRENGIAYWNPATQSLDPIKPVSGGIRWFYADEGETIVFREQALSRGALPSYYYARISDLLEHKKIFQYFTVPSGYYPTDLSLAEGSLLVNKITDFDESDDTVRIFDLSGNLKRKISGSP
jgi:hypothetical protein